MEHSSIIAAYLLCPQQISCHTYVVHLPWTNMTLCWSWRFRCVSSYLHHMGQTIRPESQAAGCTECPVGVCPRHILRTPCCVLPGLLKMRGLVIGNFTVLWAKGDVKAADCRSSLLGGLFLAGWLHCLWWEEHTSAYISNQYGSMKPTLGSLWSTENEKIKANTFSLSL